MTRSPLVVTLGLSLSTALIATACHDAAPTHAARRTAPIIGGTPVGGAYPAVGLLADLSGTDPSFVCSGVLVASDAVLTAAHCVESANPNSLGFALVSELSGLDKRAFRSPARIDVEPLYSGITNAPLGLGQANDVAVMSFSKGFAAIPVPILRPSEQPQALVSQTKVVVVGAGQNVAPPKNSGMGILRQAIVRLADIGVYELDLALQGDPQPCFGDSGGPVFWRAKDGGLRLLGVISRNSNAAVTTCQDGALATRADEYLPFIASNVTLPCGSGVDESCPDAGSGGSSDGAATSVDGGGGSSVGLGGGGGTIMPKPNSGCAVGYGGGVAPSMVLWPLLLLGLLVTHRPRRLEER